MIENFFERPHTLRRLRSMCTGPHIDAFATLLSEQGYSRNRGRGLIRGLAHLGHWLDERSVELAALDEATLKTFVAEVKRSACGNGKPKSCQASGRRFLTWAREGGFVTTPHPEALMPALIRDFEAWMKRHRNLSTVTLRNYRLPLRRLLDAVGDPGQFDVASIRRFILVESQRAGRGYAKLVVTAVRMLLRYLAIDGQCAPELVDAVPTIANWKLAALPTYVSREDIDRIIDACEPSTVAGLRDRAMVLLMARLGLRAGDVVGLRLGDIDWIEATIAVSGKCRRSARMPLPQDVGDAMLHWLTDGRADGDDDHVFLRLRAPRGPLTNAALNNVVVRAAKRAGLTLPRVGPHVLRHSAATALVNEGMSLPAIGALLRHQKLDTTTIYAKVDMGLLGSVVRPWPMEVSR